MTNILKSSCIGNENESNQAPLKAVTKKRIRIDNPRRVRQFLNKITNELYYGNMSNETARALNSLMVTYLKVFEIEKSTTKPRFETFGDIPNLEDL